MFTVLCIYKFYGAIIDKECNAFQVTALGAAVAAGSALGIWRLGAKMEGVTVYR
jgi:hypothetical protein